MTKPAGAGSHFSATVKVPRSAHAVDFVLSDVAEGEGVYDNRGGLDYHLPVEGSEVRPGLGHEMSATSAGAFLHILGTLRRQLYRKLVAGSTA